MTKKIKINPNTLHGNQRQQHKICKENVQTKFNLNNV